MKAEELQALSDAQVCEIGRRYWEKARRCKEESAANELIKSGMQCAVELERRAEFRKVNR